jgi:hypothetical protein
MSKTKLSGGRVMYEYAARYNLGGPVVHKRSADGGKTWERYTPTFDHVTPEMKARFRELVERGQLPQMKMESTRVH